MSGEGYTPEKAKVTAKLIGHFGSAKKAKEVIKHNESKQLAMFEEGGADKIRLDEDLAKSMSELAKINGYPKTNYQARERVDKETMKRYHIWLKGANKAHYKQLAKEQNRPPTPTPETPTTTTTRKGFPTGAKRARERGPIVSRPENPIENSTSGIPGSGVRTTTDPGGGLEELGSATPLASVTRRGPTQASMWRNKNYKNRYQLPKLHRIKKKCDWRRKPGEFYADTAVATDPKTGRSYRYTTAKTLHSAGDDDDPELFPDNRPGMKRAGSDKYSHLITYKYPDVVLTALHEAAHDYRHRKPAPRLLETYQKLNDRYLATGESNAHLTKGEIEHMAREGNIDSWRPPNVVPHEKYLQRSQIPAKTHIFRKRKGRRRK